MTRCFRSGHPTAVLSDSSPPAGTETNRPRHRSRSGTRAGRRRSRWRMALRRHDSVHGFARQRTRAADCGDRWHASHRRQTGTIPQILPDGRHFIYFVPQAFTPDDRGIWVAAVDGSESHRLTDADSAAVFVPARHLLFVRQGTLVAQAIDLSTLRLEGSAFSVAADMSINEPPLAAGISSSAAGLDDIHSDPPVDSDKWRGSIIGRVAGKGRDALQQHPEPIDFAGWKSARISPNGQWQLGYHCSRAPTRSPQPIHLTSCRRFLSTLVERCTRLLFQRNRDIYQKPTSGFWQ